MSTVRGKSNMAAEKNFMWTDEEIILLLRVVLDYKVGKAGEGVDWETARNKEIKFAATCTAMSSQANPGLK